MFADDLILVSSLVKLLQKQFQIELMAWKCLKIRVNRIRHASDLVPDSSIWCYVRVDITAHDGSAFPWVTKKPWYSDVVKCLLDNAQKSFYKSLYAFFGRICRLQLPMLLCIYIRPIRPIKGIPVLGLNAGPSNVTDNKSLDCAIFRTLANISKYFPSRYIIDECRMRLRIILIHAKYPKDLSLHRPINWVNLMLVFFLKMDIYQAQNQLWKSAVHIDEAQPPRPS